MLLDKPDYLAVLDGKKIEVKRKTLTGECYRFCTIEYDTAAVSAKYEDVESLVELAMKCGGMK